MAKKQKSPSPRFIPQPDDDDTLWNVECILDERKREYLVKWEGVDATGKPWPNDWVKKGDVTDECVIEWKEKKKAEKAASKAKCKCNCSIINKLILIVRPCLSQSLHKVTKVHR